MRFFYWGILISSFGGLAACTGPEPVLVGDTNPTGAAVIATPSTYGVTTLTTTQGSQRACTEPRPNASLASIIGGEANLNSQEIRTVIDAAGSGGVTVGESNEFESVEFLAHGLFGICQLAASGAIDQVTAIAMVRELVETAGRMSRDEPASTTP